MKGRILAYDTTGGSGKLITQDKQRYSFSIENCWVDFEKVPEVGMLVYCTIENGQLAEMESFREDTPPPEAQNTATTPQSKPLINTPQGEETSKSNSESEKPSQKNQTEPTTDVSKSEKPAAEEEPEIDMTPISMTKSIDECIDEFFTLIRRTVKDEEDSMHAERKLEFLKMRRFLLTAYNNMYEMDRDFFDDELQMLKRNLMGVFKVYEGFKSKSTYPKVAYESVFLSQQEEYVKARTDVDIKNGQISALAATELATREELKEKEKVYLKLVQKGRSPALAKLIESIKALKKKDVDLIHKIGVLKEEVAAISKKVIEFRDRYYEMFARHFSEESEMYEKKLVRIMDAKAYELDFNLWQKARESEIVINFFKTAQITEEFGSVGFLRYYLKNLDATKLNDENRQLMDLLKSLESMASKKVLILSEDVQKANELKQEIAGIDKDFLINASARPKDALKWAQSNPVDLILLDSNMRAMSGLDFIKQFNSKKGKEASYTTIVLMAPSISREEVIKAGNLGIKEFITDRMPKQDVHSKIRTLLGKN